LKRRDLEKKLVALGWRLKRHGGKHDYWTNGDREEAVPRHKEINEILAKKIIRIAESERR
jgi:mRNA interferase HicA